MMSIKVCKLAFIISSFSFPFNFNAMSKFAAALVHALKTAISHDVESFMTLLSNQVNIGGKTKAQVTAWITAFGFDGVSIVDHNGEGIMLKLPIPPNLLNVMMEVNNVNLSDSEI